MSLLECAAEPEIFFSNNWTSTDVEFPDRQIDPTLETYISLNYFPVTNQQIGYDATTMGRVASHGISQVLCYHKTKKQCLKLADDVKAFFGGVELPKDIHIDIGIDYPAIELDTLFECRVTFKLLQYS